MNPLKRSRLEPAGSQGSGDVRMARGYYEMREAISCHVQSRRAGRISQGCSDQQMAMDELMLCWHKNNKHSPPRKAAIPGGGGVRRFEVEEHEHLITSSGRTPVAVHVSHTLCVVAVPGRVQTLYCFV